MMTDQPSKQYIGRFAPSPTGPMHEGTLVAAMASYLDARIHQGKWLLRIEDIDPPREVAGSANTIISTLDQLGFQWDDEISYQSRRHHYYQDVITSLLDEKLAYACNCSRKTIAANAPEPSGEIIYQGACRNKKLATKGEVAIRVVTDGQTTGFTDRIGDFYYQNIEQQCGDFVVRRKDGLYAYQLAVVVDDNEQRVNQVVRGADLLDSTPRQIYLHKLLDFPVPEYAHFPVLLDDQGVKFSKSSFSGKPLIANLNSLIKAWHHLNQMPIHSSDFDDIDDFWSCAIEHWQIDKLKKIK